MDAKAAPAKTKTPTKRRIGNERPPTGSQGRLILEQIKTNIGKSKPKSFLTEGGWNFKIGYYLDNPKSYILSFQIDAHA